MLGGFRRKDNNYTDRENKEYQTPRDQVAAELGKEKLRESLLAADAVYMSELSIVAIYYYNHS